MLELLLSVSDFEGCCASTTYLKQKKSLRSKLNEVTAYLFKFNVGTPNRPKWTIQSAKGAI